MRFRPFAEVRESVVRAADAVTQSSHSVSSVSDRLAGAAWTLVAVACVALAYVLYRWKP